MAKFVVDLAFNETKYGGRGDLKIIDNVVAFHNYSRDGKPCQTIIPGYYVGELESKESLRSMEVKIIPSDKRRDIGEMLKERGYVEPFFFWQEDF